jgi:hypothetical protein
VQAQDEQNASVQEQFTVILTDVYEHVSGEYQSPSESYQTPDGNYQSPEGSSPIVEQNETSPIEEIEIFLPILQTFTPQTNSNGTYNLTGEILTNGGSPVFEAGFLLSKKIFLSDPIRLVSVLDPNATEFYSSVSDLSPSTTYYFRAFAVNEAGENRGSLKKFTTPEQIDSNSWFLGTQELPDGWRKSDWLGIFKPTTHQWFYHVEMGWLYPSPMSDGSVWLWSQKNGWLWTGSGIYPQLFKHDSGTWLYFIGKINSKPRFYDYLTGTIN